MWWMDVLRCIMVIWWPLVSWQFLAGCPSGDALHDGVTGHTNALLGVYDLAADLPGPCISLIELSLALCGEACAVSW